MPLIKEIPIRKLNDEKTNYYPLSVGESVVTTTEIRVTNDVGGFNKGDTIPRITSLRTILETLFGGEEREELEVDNKTIVIDDNCISVNLDGDTLIYDSVSGKIKVNTDVLATKTYVDNDIRNIRNNYATTTYVDNKTRILATKEVVNNISSVVNELPTMSEVEEAINEAISEIPTPEGIEELSSFVDTLPTKAEVDEAINEAISDLPLPEEIEAISSFVDTLPTKAEVDEAINEAISELPPPEEIYELSSYVYDNLPTRQEVLEAIDLSTDGLATEVYVDDSIREEDTAIRNYIDSIFNYKQISITQFSKNTDNTIEKGNNITTDIVFTIKVSKEASNFEFTTASDGAFDIKPNDYSEERTITKGDFTYSILKNSSTQITITLLLTDTGKSISSNSTWKIRATEKDKKPTESQPYTTGYSQTTVSFYWRVFYGSKAEPSIINEDFIENQLSSAVRGGKSYSDLSLTTGANEYMWYCVPVGYGTCSFTDRGSGFTAAFEDPLTVSVKNAYNQTTNYYVYRSTFANLGNIHLDIT